MTLNTKAPPKNKRPTLRTIAELTGLAVTTVSRALANDALIAVATRARVAKVAEEIGYVPDRAAQRLRTGRTNTISFLLSPHEELLGFSNSMIMGLSRAFQESQFNLVITPCFEGSTEVATVQSIINNKMADGVIFSRTEPFDERVRLLMENNFPFISHGQTEFSSPHLFLDFDNDKFAQLAVQRLVKKGRKKLYCVMPDRKFTFYRHLKYGFTSAAIEAGVQYEIPKDINLDETQELLYDAVAKALKSETPPDGFVCAGEVLAMMVMACMDDHGFVVGKDADIVVKQTSAVYDYIRPKIDAVFEDIAEASEQMGRLLLKKIKNPNDEFEGIIQQPIVRFLT